MTMRRITGHRRIAVCAGDPRVAGEYEQTVERPSILATHRFLAPEFAAEAVISCTGRVRRTDGLDLGTLVELARLQPNGDFGVEMVDLLAIVGLEHEAEVVVFTDAADEQLAVPVRELMHGGRLVLGTIENLLHLPISLSVRLELAGWTQDDERFRPVAMSACSFHEFVQVR